MVGDLYDSGQLVAKASAGGHLVDQNGVCIRCLCCDDPECCDRPMPCTFPVLQIDGQVSQ